ncbi:serpentine type 7TM GPCR chemoreceptor srsx domain-containing protein [Ditylenchus destructor]|uniref:Serpentine type 7TM GPCR chemoreceptor srsx domain-containing protein n=1 Tax=Ditylenchus destructor TaxID=166010 RepID=A0AAD4QYQ7_9BILA|nr:serpentine type 7TM GPCR chemoreceptor srsx domain-containing protein [Ditylenchus destructor]
MESNATIVIPNCTFTWFHSFEGIKSSLGVVGALLNFVLVYVIFRNKNLHSPCGFLIASSSFCIAHWQMNLMIAFILVELDANILSTAFCIFMQAYLVFAMQGMEVLILFIALDRLFNVALPTWTRNLQKQNYFLIMLTIAVAYVGYSTYECVDSAIRILKGIDSLKCVCFDIATPRVVQFMMIFNACSVFCYIVLWLLLKFKSKSKVNKRIFKALAIIMLVDVLGWSSSTIIWNLSAFVKFSPMVEYYLRTVIQLILVLTTSSNSIVLLATSTDYRQAYSRVFPRMFNCFSKLKNKINSSTSGNNNILFVASESGRNTTR